MHDATVTIEFLEIASITRANPTPGATFYALGFVGDRRTGRSRPIAGATLALSAEAVPWRFEVRVSNGDNIELKLELHEDRGDAAPSGALSTLLHTVTDPWSSGERTVGQGPTLRFKVATERITTAVPVLARRVPEGQPPPSATVRSRRAFIVDITQIDGLYRPISSPPPTGMRSESVAGYISEDDRGRIYINRDHTGVWTKDTQYIDLHARVTAVGGATVPPGTELQWTVSDPDDPFNDAPDCHRVWGEYIDENDYSGGTSRGAHADDNLLAHSPGNTSLANVFDQTPPWSQTPGGPAPTAPSTTQARTALSAGAAANTSVTSVRLHCPNVGGANIRVRAALHPVPSRPVHAAETGLMTMWKRIDVEVVKMSGAFPLTGALPGIPEFLEPACVQLDMQPERALPASLSHRHMTGVGGNTSTATRTWIDTPGVFTHKGQAGWFFLGSAMLSKQLPSGASGGVLHSANGGFTFGRSGSFQTVVVPGNVSAADYVRFIWEDVVHGRTVRGFSTPQQVVGFKVRGTSAFDSGANRTTIQLWGHDVRNRFTGHNSDGSLGTAGGTLMFYPKGQVDRSGSWAVGAKGYDVPLTARINVMEPGAFSTSGISPRVPSGITGTGLHFAGRTVLFSHHGVFSRRASSGSGLRPEADFDSRVVQTVVHEFVHAFGMPHKCGHFNWRTPREKTCAMNYSPNWMADASDTLLPGSNNKVDKHLCGRHLMEVRRVHLERNTGLNW